MKSSSSALWLALALAAASAAPAAEYESFSIAEAEVGKLPTGWTAAKTGDGEGSVWMVVEDETAPEGKALAQTSAEGPKALFNLCIAKDATYADLDLTLAFKAIAGKIDQGGGPVWRCRDANNYYVARANPLENNYRVYKVVDGQRSQLGTADVETPAGKWHTIRIVHQGPRIQCFLNDKLHLEVEDETFQDAGKVGLWTKADAQTRFAGIKIRGK